MTAVIITKYIHFISIFLVFSTLFLEYQLLTREIDRKTLRKILKIDGLYGLFAITTVVAGLTLWLWVGKPPEFYANTGIIYIKLGLFIIVGLLSIIPSVFFSRNKKGDNSDIISIPARLRAIVLAELLILITIPALATMMANGIPLF